MPQSLVLGNGNLLVNLNRSGEMTDVYYPYVGQENHTAYGNPHRVGIWVDDQFSWTRDDEWESSVTYEDSTLVGNTVLTHNRLGVQLHFQDFVYTTHDIFFRRVSITNLKEYHREIRFYAGHDFYIYGDKQQDTALYDPDFKGVMHYRQRRYFCLSGAWENNGEGMSEYSVGKANYGDREGSWKDAEDGHLHGNPIEQGSVDSIAGFYKGFEPGETQVLNLWLMVGKSEADIQKNYFRIEQLGTQNIYEHTRDYWKMYGDKSGIKLKGLGSDIEKLWHHSLLMIRTQTDNRGAIIASNDSDIMEFNRDTYTYMWPRDGALVSMALSRTGYWEPVQRFLHFCKDLVTPGGYVHHKFHPDQSLGSSWHPKIAHGKPQLPIQEDESALILVALWEYYETSRMVETVKEMFNPVVLTIGRFLQSYIDEKTGLPKPSYDLWEEQYGVFSYTAATVYAGLKAAADLSRITGHMKDAQSFEASAKSMKKTIIEHLYCPADKRFAKRIEIKPDGEHFFDKTVDSSICFLWELGVLDSDDPRMESTMKAIEDQLTIHIEVGGIARYTGDYYHKSWDYEYSEKVPGNPWIISTLWVANWYIEKAKNRKQLKRAKEIIEWAASKANSAGILPEQVHPFTNEPLSVAPLTWSHATFVDTCLRFSKKWEKLK